MPPGFTDSQLADQFAEYFINKIDKIRDSFFGSDPYKATENDVPQLKKFTSMMEQQIS